MRGGTRPGAGRKPNAVPTIVKSIRLTEAEWAKLSSLGGADWIRLKLRTVKVP